MSEPTTWFYYITPDGDSVLLNNHVDTFFLEEDGFGLETVDPVGQRVAFEHGQIVQMAYCPERVVMIRLGIMAANDLAWRDRDNQLCRLCSPFIDEETPGTLRRVRVDGEVRDIGAWLIGYAKPSKDREGPCYGERVLKFWCPDPFFYDPTPTEYNYNVQTEGGFEYPFYYPFSYAETNLNAHNTIYNFGDVKTWPSIYIYGPLRNPTITNDTTDETISISQTLDAGDYINVDMYNCEVSFYDQSAATTTDISHLMTTTSLFWALKRGANMVHFTALDVENGGIVFSYNNRYQCI